MASIYQDGQDEGILASNNCCIAAHTSLGIYRHSGPLVLCTVLLSGPILFILPILEILLQTTKTRAWHIQVLSDLVILFSADAIDIQVLSDLAFILCILHILQILHILAILLQTRRRDSGGQAPALQKNASVPVARGPVPRNATKKSAPRTP